MGTQAHEPDSDDGVHSPTLSGAALKVPVMAAPADVAEATRALGAAPLFHRFAPADLEALVAHVAARGTLRRVHYADGAQIVREGDAAKHLLVILDGKVSVYKRGDAGGEVEVNRMGPGDCIGELALIDPAPRSASARAIGPVNAMALPIDDILQLAEQRPGVSTGLLGMARVITARLRVATAGLVDSLEQSLAEQRKRATLGRFTFVLIVAYSLYTWLLGTATHVKQLLGRSELVTLPVVLVTAGLLFAFMRSSGFPARFFGLTWRHAGRHAAEALLFTLPCMAAVVALKWWLVNHVPSMQGAPLFQMGAAGGGAASAFNPWLTLVYIVFVPLQELIYRGGLQGTLEEFLAGRWRTLQAVIGSNIIFSAAHLYISPGLSVTAFVAGLFWGWLYARQRGLVGVSLSHIVLGFFAFEVVDLGVLE